MMEHPSRNTLPARHPNPLGAICMVAFREALCQLPPKTISVANTA
jgi:hypothetical protein